MTATFAGVTKGGDRDFLLTNEQSKRIAKAHLRLLEQLALVQFERDKLKKDNDRMKELIMGRLGDYVVNLEKGTRPDYFRAWVKKWAEDFLRERERIQRSKQATLEETA